MCYKDPVKSPYLNLLEDTHRVSYIYFLSKKNFYDKMDLRLLYFHVTKYHFDSREFVNDTHDVPEGTQPKLGVLHTFIWLS